MSADDKTKLDGVVAGTQADAGVIGVAQFNMVTAPTAGDVFDIGANGYDFVGALIAAYGRTQILIGTATQTRTRMADAIKGAVDASVVYATGFVAPNLTAFQSTPAHRVIVFNADAPAGTPIAGTQNLALSKTTVAATSKWDRVNLNETGGAASNKTVSRGSFLVDATNIAYGANPGFVVELPFTATAAIYQAFSASGVQRFPAVGTFTGPNPSVPGAVLLWIFPGGAVPEIQAGDYVFWEAWS